MIKTVNAVYEDGCFIPQKKMYIADGMKVKLIIESDDEESVDDILNLATGVYEGLSDKEINEVEEIAFDRKDLFE